MSVRVRDRETVCLACACVRARQGDSVSACMHACETGKQCVCMRACVRARQGDSVSACVRACVRDRETAYLRACGRGRPSVSVSRTRTDIWAPYKSATASFHVFRVKRLDYLLKFFHFHVFLRTYLSIILVNKNLDCVHTYPQHFPSLLPLQNLPSPSKLLISRNYISGIT